MLKIWQVIGNKSINNNKYSSFYSYQPELLSWFTDLRWRPNDAWGDQRMDDLLVSVNENMKKTTYRTEFFSLCLFLWKQFFYVINSCAHLLPAPVHEQVDVIWSQVWLQQPEAWVQGLHNFSIGAVLIRKAALIVHLPHEHTWLGGGGVSEIDWRLICKLLFFSI